MKPKLLLQPNVFNECSDITTAIISKYFDITELSDLQQLLDIEWDNKFRGSIALATRLGHNFSLTDVTHWLPPLRQLYLTNNYYFDSLDHIISKGIALDKVFIRPVSGKKIFSGQLFNLKELKQERDYLKSRNIEDTLLCLVSEPVTIYEEYRLVYINNKFISGSKYLSDGELDISSVVPKVITKFANNVVKHPIFLNQFDFVVDVGITKEGIKLIEINSFETSSFYASDLDKIYITWANS